jgi:ABC-type molybdate transport system ATPase subunit
VRRNLLFGAPRHNGGSAKGAIDFDEVVELLGVGRLLDRSPRKPNARGSQSGARCCRSRSSC